MARESFIQINYTTNIEQIRSEYEALAKQIESRSINVGGSPAGMPAGRGPMAAVDNPATFGNRGGSYVQPWNPAGLAGNRFTMSGGSYTQLQNGTPGLMPGGVGSSIGGVKSVGDQIGQAMKNAGDAIAQKLEEAADRIAASMAEGVSRATSSPSSGIPSGGRGGASSIGRVYREIDQARREWVDYVGVDDERASQTWNHMQNLRTRAAAMGSVADPSQEPSTAKFLGRAISGYMIAGAVGGLAGQIAGAGDQIYGASYTGSSASVAARQSLAKYQAFHGAISSIPILGGAVGGLVDLGEAIGSYAAGRGFRTYGSVRGQEITEAERSQSDIYETMSRAWNIRALSSNGDTEAQINARHRARMEENTGKIEGDAYYFDRDTQTYRHNGYAKLQQMNEESAGIANNELRGFFGGIAQTNAMTGVASRSGRAEYSRDFLSAAYEGTVGAAATAYKNENNDRREVDSRVRLAWQQYKNQRALFIRGNMEASTDMFGESYGDYLSTTGNTFSGQRQKINTETNAKEREVGTTGNAITDFLFGVTPRKWAIRFGGWVQNRGVDISEKSYQIQTQGITQASQLTLQDRPYDAAMSAAYSRYQSSIYGKTPGSPEYERAAASYNAEWQGIAKGFADDRQRVRTAQEFSGKSLDRQLQRDYIGAQAYDIAGSAIADARNLYRGQHYEESAEARIQGSKRIDLLQKEYTYGFRAESFDLRLMAINNPRDSQDPAEVYKQFTNARNDIQNAKMQSDYEPKGYASGAGGNGSASTVELGTESKSILTEMREMLKSVTTG